MNIQAVEDLREKHPAPELVLIESGGDNLTELLSGKGVKPLADFIIEQVYCRAGGLEERCSSCS
ncbi:P-loop NTPase family protein [Candidatus Desulfovibrio trichonymphae]|uniref:hypothetical protein n=1 Tax=Candidatus Desulfovibrio trichonymphae TaxID=1725232 RepID=UPI000BBACFE1|nr:hypothetical protein [Candidatus Desulfovibrio trichonymphae]GHU91203.1 hypothetical protein AGMMS49925_05510 [Deltaproteobacteria bacterium]GHU94826.1 hypothetical protein AGMMS49974_04980 [Deltaproteobacteria bacterium]GHV00025.1 hypothetical protein AGMMS50248_09060 [Deltaproteobacteria bacterium]